MVFDFLLTQEENVGGWRARERGRGGGGGFGGILNLCLTPHLSHGIWFVFKQWSQWQVHFSYPGSNQHQVGGSQAGFCSHRPAWPTGWDFHVITYPSLTPAWRQGFPLFAVSFSSTPSHPHPLLALFCHVFNSPGGYSSREQRDPRWRSLPLV